MVVVAQYIERVKVSHYIAVHYVLQGHWSIIRCLMSVALP